MHPIQEVTVFSLGDSRQVRAWSNVPYFFTETLLAKGVRVNRVDLKPGLFGGLLNRTVFRALRWAVPGTTYDYFRSALHYMDAKRRIRRAVARYPQADAHIFLTFSFSSADVSDKPTLLFGDWTYDHHFRHFLNREPDWLERNSVARENREIDQADHVFVLFPAVAEEMKRRHPGTRITYAGNVVNSLLKVSEEDVLAHKRESQALLFVGDTKYREGAKRLLAAFAILKRTFPRLSLDIVGMTEKDLEALPPGVRCHGYLDKGKDADRDKYYRLLLDARCIVNPTPRWGAFSAMVEGMYFYNPVIAAPYDEFVETFGSKIDFGLYCHSGDEHTALPILCDCVTSLLADEGYEARCRAAHVAVKDYTWSAYIDRVLAALAALPPRAEGRAAISTLSA